MCLCAASDLFIAHRKVAVKLDERAKLFPGADGVGKLVNALPANRQRQHEIYLVQARA